MQIRKVNEGDWGEGRKSRNTEPSPLIVLRISRSQETENPDWSITYHVVKSKKQTTAFAIMVPDGRDVFRWDA